MIGRRLWYVVLLVSWVSVSCSRSVSVLDQAKADFRAANWHSAIHTCDRLIAVDPEHEAALMLRGRCYIALEQFDNAVQDFSFLAKLNPEDPEPLYHRSIAYKGLGEAELADADHMQARQLDPLHKSAYAFAPGNFLPKPSISFSGEPFSDEADTDEQTDVETETEESLDDRGLADSRLDESDFYGEPLDDPLQAEPEESEGIFDIPASARPRISDTSIDHNAVRDAVRDYRDLIRQDAKPKSLVPPPVLGGTRSKSKWSIDKLADRKAKAEQSKDGEQAEKERRSQLIPPPISTALPPDFLNPGGNGISGITPNTPSGLFRPRAGVTGSTFRPSANPNIPGNPFAQPTIGIGSTGDPRYRLHANPVYTPSNAKPTLQTGLPSGTVGIAGGTTQTTAPATANRRLPSMLPKIQPADRP